MTTGAGSVELSDCQLAGRGSARPAPPRRRREDALDPGLVLAQLTRSERESLASLLESIGLEEADWGAALDLQRFLEVVAVARHATRYEDVGNRADRWRMAAEDLGLEDAPDRRSHPAERVIRRWYRWLEHARASELTSCQRPSARAL